MFNEKLDTYLIPGARTFVNRWCKDIPLQIAFTPPRKTVLGNYSKKGNVHRVTVNNNLDKELAFHILTHEMAHMLARIAYGRRIQPHGKEWKSIFAKMILETLHLYDPKFQQILHAFAQNPRAGYYSYPPMVAYFQAKSPQQERLIQDLAEGTIFKVKDKIYKKGRKIKIRYLCTNLDTGRAYAFHPMAPIKEIIEDGYEEK